MAEIPAGMVPWNGGEEAPADWDGGDVLLRSGVHDEPHWWTHGLDAWGARTSGQSDIIAYTPKATPDPVLAAPGEWRMVPVEATEAMLDAGRFAYKDGVGGRRGISRDDVRRIWSAMLAAAPAPPIADVSRRQEQ